MNEERFKLDEYEAKLLLHMPAFKEAVQTMRVRWKIPANGFDDNKARNAWNSYITANGIDAEIHEAIHGLAKKLNYSERWEEGIFLYLQTNNPFMLRAKVPYEIKANFEGQPLERKDTRSVWIRVYSDTNEREIRNALRDTKELFDMKHGKKQLYANLDRDLAILDLHEKGMKNATIARWLEDNNYGSFTVNDVAKFLKHTKRRLKY